MILTHILAEEPHRAIDFLRIEKIGFLRHALFHGDHVVNNRARDSHDDACVVRDRDHIVADDLARSLDDMKHGAGYEREIGIVDAGLES